MSVSFVEVKGREPFSRSPDRAVMCREQPRLRKLSPDHGPDRYEPGPRRKTVLAQDSPAICRIDPPKVHSNVQSEPPVEWIQPFHTIRQSK